MSSSADSANVFDQDQSLGYIFNNSNQHSRYIRPVRAFSPGLVVTYNSQSGSAVSAGSTTSGGSVSSSPGSPTRAGYSFSGWFAASTGGSAITFPYSHGQTSDFTLYAQWSAAMYVVSFDGNGSTGGSVPGNQTKTHGVILTLSSNTGSLVKTGYTFGGWNSAANGSGTSYAAGASYEENAAVTLYAQWTANSLTVTYDSQSGSAVSDGSTTTGGTLASLPTTSREGYTFDGWFTAASGGSQLATSSPHGQTADFTLYAQWSAAMYVVSF
ncbi:MAG: InlB B-repeat-containing protein, partial [Ilumatobacteraceae bacterium]